MGGCVYSCNRDGSYGRCVEDDDDKSMGPDVAEAREESSGIMAQESDADNVDSVNANRNPKQMLALHGIHHYCIVLQKELWPE
jgi:hypothetical protein